jgi:hypothetical protein
VLENGDTTMAKTNRTITRGDALAALAQDYRQKVEDLAERLRPRIESGELAPWHPWDERWEEPRPHRGPQAPPGDRLEIICRRELARTFVDAYVVLAVSPSEKDLDDGLDLRAARAAAAECIAKDVLDLGRRDGWYTPPTPPSQERVRELAGDEEAAA